MVVGLIYLGVVALAGAYAVAVYNRLVRQRNHYQNSFAQIEVQLKRRYDLIPNLVEAARGYLRHEQEALTAVMQARNGAMQASAAAARRPGSPAAMEQLGAAEGTLAGRLGQLYAVVEQYPVLKGDATIIRVMEELASTENRVAFARQAYNDAVTTYNTTRETFPPLVIAWLLDFERAELFEVDTREERQAPRISFA